MQHRPQDCLQNAYVKLSHRGGCRRVVPPRSQHTSHARGGVPESNEKVEGLRVGFAVVVAAVVVEPRRFSRGNWCLQFPKALVRNESRRTASPKKELGWERGSKSSRKIVEKKVLRMKFSIVEILSGLQESISNLFRRPQLHSREKSKN